MSTSIAAAKKRRAPAPVQVPVSQSTMGVQQPPQQPQGLTLPQVISLVDKRLNVLETTVKGLAESSVDTHESAQIPSNITEVLDEFNARFDHLAGEIEGIKNIVLSLQSYTMDVNKMLLEDRVQLLSGNTSTPLEESFNERIASF